MEEAAHLAAGPQVLLVTALTSPEGLEAMEVTHLTGSLGTSAAVEVLEPEVVLEVAFSLKSVGR